MFKLLIIDDEQVIREGLSAYIQRFFPEELEWVKFAENGLDAWNLIEEGFIPDILITDIRMPKCDGIEFMRKIRNEKKLEVKVIVLSGYNDFEYVRDMALLGIENYFLKPVNEEELALTIRNTLEKIKKERELCLHTRLNEELIQENIINRWLYGTIGEDELVERAEFLNLNLEAGSYCPCQIQILGKEECRDNRLFDQIYDICREVLGTCEDCYCSRSYSGDVLAIFCFDDQERIAGYLNQCLEEIYQKTDRKAYVLLGNCVEDYWKVAESYRNAIKNGVHIRQVDLAPKKEQQERETISPLSLRVAQYVLEHYQEELSLKTIAAAFHGNAAYIGQVFKKDMNTTFSDYIRDVRIEKAKEFLLKTQYSTREIAVKVGFSNTTYFCTVFKKETGLSPDRYRKECR